MRRIFIALTLSTLAASPAFAQSIAFVNVERAIATVAEGRAELAELEKWRAPLEQELTTLKASAEEAAINLQRQGQVASGEALSRMETAARDSKRRFEDAAREYTREREKLEEDILRAITPKLRKVINEYAESNNFDAVFIFKDQTLVYLADRADITEGVIAAYDAAHPAK